jgi:hypothetical protein
MEEGGSPHVVNKTSSLLTPYSRSNFTHQVGSYIGGRTMHIKVPVWALSYGLVARRTPFSLGPAGDAGRYRERCADPCPGPSG